MALRRIDHAEARDRAPFFVLGALDALEMAEVREHLQTCDQEHPEFLELGGVVPYLAISVEPVDGGPELRQRVMAAIAAENRAAVRDDAVAERLIASFEHPAATAGDTTATEPSPAADTTTPASEAAGPATTGPVAGDDRQSTLWVDQPGGRPAGTAPISLADQARARGLTQRWLLPAVAVLLIGVLGAWNVSLTQQAGELARRTAELRTALAVAAAPGARVARLSGDASAPNVSGFAAFRSDGTGVLVLEGLAPAPSGRTYQAWYLAGGQPRSAGLVRVDADGLVVATGLQPGGPVDAVALTIEPAGGSQQPSTTPFVVGTFA